MPELAFLYDVFFTSNAFLHYYESKAATVWAFASVIGICFVGVAAVTPGTRTSRNFGGTTVVDTTGADLMITLIILASLALLRVLQLIRCWTSNWARAAFVCDYIRNGEQMTCWMMLRRWILRTACNSHLWQNKLGQYSLVESISSRERELFRLHALGPHLYSTYSQLSRMLGLQLIEQVLQEVWGVKTGDAIELDPAVKAAIVYLLVTCGDRRLWHEPFLSGTASRYCSSYHGFVDPNDHLATIMTWHVATCYCELVACKEGFPAAEDEEFEKTQHRVATALSRYCAYLVVSAPQLLPGQHLNTGSMFSQVAGAARTCLQGAKNKLEAMRRSEASWRR